MAKKYQKHTAAFPNELFVPKGRLPLAEELELSRTIEQAELRMLEALAASPLALDELRTICRDVGEGWLSPAELLRVPPEARDLEGRRRIERDVVGGIAKLNKAMAADVAHSGPEALEIARTAFIEALSKDRLSHRAVTRVLDRVSAALHGTAGPQRARLERLGRVAAANLQLGEEAREQLLRANLGLVAWLVRKRLHECLSGDDLMQEGCLGLMRAIERFDYRRGLRFNTYAAWWVRACVNRALSEQGRTIRLPTHVVEARSRIAKQLEHFVKESGQLPNLQELAQALNVSPVKLQEVLSFPGRPSSLDAPLSFETGLTLQEVMPDPGVENPLQRMAADDTRQRVLKLLHSLPNREQQVLRLRFGFEGPGGLTLEEIGEKISLSRERVRQIEGAALDKLRVQAEADDLNVDLASR